jgi:hypothetical protein
MMKRWPLTPAPSLDILDLLTHLLDQQFQIERDARDFDVDPKARPIAMLASSAPTLASVRHFPRVMTDPVRTSFPSPLYGLSKRMSWAC